MVNKKMFINLTLFGLFFMSADLRAAPESDDCSSAMTGWREDLASTASSSYAFCRSKGNDEEFCNKAADKEKNAVSEHHAGTVFEACNFGEPLEDSQVKALKKYAKKKHGSVPNWLKKL